MCNSANLKTFSNIALLLIHRAKYLRCSGNTKEYSLATKVPVIHVLSAEKLLLGSSTFVSEHRSVKVKVGILGFLTTSVTISKFYF